MKKAIVILLIIALVVVGFIGFQQGWFTGEVADAREIIIDREEPTIIDGELVDGEFFVGLVQFAPHPALDAAREGFIAGLREEGFIEGQNITFRTLNSNGDMSTLNLMAQQIVDENPNLILSIATPTSIALRNVTQDIPIMITAVTDPLRIDGVDSLELPGANVSGTSDRTPVAAQFEFIQRVLPETQTIGILYNAGEINAVIQAEWAENAANALGLTPRRFSVATGADVVQVAEAAAGQVDVIYLPTCNLMAQAYVTVVMAADGAGIPVIAGESGGVLQGALATEGIDYFELGRQTAIMAAAILRGETEPATMPIQFQSNYAIAVNLVTAERLGIEIPQDIVDAANFRVRFAD